MYVPHPLHMLLFNVQEFYILGIQISATYGNPNQITIVWNHIMIVHLKFKIGLWDLLF